MRFIYTPKTKAHSLILQNQTQRNKKKLEIRRRRQTFQELEVVGYTYTDELTTMYKLVAPSPFA